MKSQDACNNAHRFEELAALFFIHSDERVTVGTFMSVPLRQYNGPPDEVNNTQ